MIKTTLTAVIFGLVLTAAGTSQAQFTTVSMPLLTFPDGKSAPSSRDAKCETAPCPNQG